MNILVLCTCNSARSILLESLLNLEGGSRVNAWSAGPKPVGRVHPLALDLLRSKAIDTSGARSKSWNEFTEADAPVMDLVISVCTGIDEAALQALHGAPMWTQWPVEDPTIVAPAGQPAAFAGVFDVLERRARAFLALPFETLSRAELGVELDRIAGV